MINKILIVLLIFIEFNANLKAETYTPDWELYTETDTEIKYYVDLNSYFQNFKYISYFLSSKCKLISQNDSRECNIYQDKNIISVNCGKITGIFEFEEYILNNLNI